MKKLLLPLIALLLLTGCASGAPPLQTMSPEQEAAVRPTPNLVIEAGGRIFYADLEHDPSAEAFVEKLSAGPLELELHDNGGVEKVGSLPWTLEESGEELTAEPGDLILYPGNRLAVCCGQNAGTFTRLARIGGLSGDELRRILGDGDVTVSLWIEWSE